MSRPDDINSKFPKSNCPPGCHECCKVAKQEGPLLTFGLSDNVCANLVDGRCSIYDDRPLVCRAFGVTEGLLCPHDCHPDRIISGSELLGTAIEGLQSNWETAI